MSDDGWKDTGQTVKLFGIPNCDQIKKARRWLTEHGIAYTFHDFKKVCLSRQLVAHWLTSTDWTTLVNRKGTTWRALPNARRAAVTDAEEATALMLETPSVVKRPVLQCGSHVVVGFDAARYQAFFSSLIASLLTLQTTEPGART